MIKQLKNQNFQNRLSSSLIQKWSLVLLFITCLQIQFNEATPCSVTTGSTLSYVVGDGIVGGVTDSAVIFKLQLVDNGGYTLSLPASNSDQLLVTVTGPSSEAVYVLSTDNKDGTFTYSYAAKTAGIYTVSVKINGVDIIGSPFKPKFVASSTCSLNYNLQNERKTRQSSALKSEKSTCSWYQDNSCCSSRDIEKLSESLEEIFEQYASEETCLANFAVVYCGVSCSPRQQSFVSNTSHPANGNSSISLTTDVRISSQLCNSWYQSCKRVLISGIPMGSIYPVASDFCSANIFIDNVNVIVTSPSNRTFNGLETVTDFSLSYVSNINGKSGNVVSIQNVKAGESISFTITSVDVFGNDRQDNSNDFYTVEVRSSTNTVKNATVVNNHDGTYTATFTETVAGTYTIRVRGNSTREIVNSPFKISVLGSEPSTQSEAILSVNGQVSQTTSLITGDVISFTINSKDVYGNYITGGNGKFSAQSFYNGTNEIKNVTVTDNCDGTYTVSKVPTIIGFYEFSFSLNGAVFYNNVIQVTAGNVNPKNSTVIGDLTCGNVKTTRSIVLQTYDNYGNKINHGGSNVQVKFQGIFSGNVLKDVTAHVVNYVDDNGDGTYEIEYESSFVGTLQITILVNGVEIQQSPLISECKSYVQCPDNCLNRGICIAGGVCVCEGEYFGENCGNAPRPWVLDASFSNSVSNSITINFNIDTNRAWMTGDDDCSKIFADTSSLGTGAFCVWKDSKTLSIYLGFRSTIKPRSFLTIESGIIMSADLTGFFTAQSFRVNAPSISPVPEVSISAPTIVGKCGDLLLSADNTGNAGKDVTYGWTVSSDINNDPRLPFIQDNLVNSVKSHQLSLTSDLLSAYFDLGREYTFYVSATNYLNQSSEQIKHKVLIAPKNTPVVTIEPSYASVYAFQTLRLVGSTDTANFACSGHSEERAIYSWIRVSGPIFELDAKTSNTPNLYIPKNTLKPGNTYQFELRSSYESTPSIFGSSIATIVVEQTPIQARIYGGDRLFTLGDDSLVLDAINENDDEGLTYTWSCVNNLFPHISCFEDDLPKIGKLEIPSSSLSIGKYTFTVVVEKEGVESKTDSVVIYTNGRGPQTLIYGPDVFNANEEIVLVADVWNKGIQEDTAASGSSFYWTTVSGDYFIGVDYTRTNLVIPANKLSSGGTYRFRLEVTNDLGRGWAEFQFTTNDRPNGGDCVIAHGTPYDAKYTISCSNWDDIDSPISYRFSRRVVGGNNFIPLHFGRIYSNNFDFVLPNGEHEILVEIFDVYGASSKVIYNVQSDLTGNLAELSSQQLIDLILGYGNLLENNYLTATYFNDQNLQIEYLSYISELLKEGTSSTRRAEQRNIVIKNILDIEVEDSDDATLLRLLVLSAASSHGSEIANDTYKQLDSSIGEFNYDKVTPQTAQYYAQLASNLLFSAYSDENSLKNTFDAVLQSLVDNIYPGQDPISYNSENVDYLVRKDSPNEFPQVLSSNGVNFYLSPELYSQYQSVAAVFTTFRKPSTSNRRQITSSSSLYIASPITKLALWGDGQAITSSSQPVFIEIPTTSPWAFDDSVATCLSRSTPSSSWSSAGCTVAAFTATTTTCSCNNLNVEYSVSIASATGALPPGSEPETPVPVNTTPTQAVFTQTINTVLIVLVIAVVGTGLVVGYYLRTKGLRARNEQAKKDFADLRMIPDSNIESNVTDADLANWNPDYVDEDEMRDYSIGSIEDFSETDAEMERKDYSIGIDDFSDDDEMNTISQEEYENNGDPTKSRLSRLTGSTDEDPTKKYGSTSTHRSSFQTEYDLDAPRMKQSTKPLTSSTRMARAKQDSTNQLRPKTTAKYAPSSTRITTSNAGRDSSSSRNLMSNTRRLTDA